MSSSQEENPEINNENNSEINSQEEPKDIQEQRSIIDPSTELGSKSIFN
jgi:hypothetical protein